MCSNCLFEALKAKIKDPKNIRIDYVPARINNGRVHFFWINLKDKKVYQYIDPKPRSRCYFLPFCGEIKLSANLELFYDFLLHKCYKHKLTVDETKKYVKIHHLPITEDDVELYYWGEEND